MRSAARLPTPGPCPRVPLPPPGRCPLPRWPRVEPARYGSPWRVSTGLGGHEDPLRPPLAAPLGSREGKGSATPLRDLRRAGAQAGGRAAGRAPIPRAGGGRRQLGLKSGRGRQGAGRGRGAGPGAGRGDGALCCWPRAAFAHLPARPAACSVPSVLAAQVAGRTGPGVRARLSRDGVGAVLTRVLRVPGGGRSGSEGRNWGSRGRCHLLQRRRERGGGRRRGSEGSAGPGPARAPPRRSAAAWSRAGESVRPGEHRGAPAALGARAALGETRALTRFFYGT